MTLQFTTYDEATEYFGIRLPRQFVNNLLIIDNFCKAEQLDTFDSLSDIFGLFRIEGNEARYRQTPIELFPFGSIGSDGIHYGFVIHTTHDDDYPAGEICPMDDDGVVLIGNNSTELFQNLLCDNSFFDRYPTLFNQLGLTRNVIDRKRYDRNENPLRVTIKPRNGWTFMDTKDGVGVFAERKYFNKYHQTKYDTLNRLKGVEEYQDLAYEMKNLGFYASQLYYLKELYWYEWTNSVFAKELLTQMLEPYEKLDRQHLYDMTKWTIETFTRRYGE
jgi:hypothetical protein